MIEKSDLIKWSDGIFGGHMPPEKEVIQQLSKDYLWLLKTVKEISSLVTFNWRIDDMSKEDSIRLTDLLRSVDEELDVKRIY